MSAHRGQHTRAQQAHRADYKARVWNPNLHLAKPPLTRTSWWVSGAAPEARDAFIELAKARARVGAWSDIVAHPTKTVL